MIKRQAITKGRVDYQLTFKADIETALFRSIPHELSKYVGELNTPTTLIPVEHSTVYKSHLVSPLLRNNNVEHEIFRVVGHLFPLDYRSKTADLIKREINQ